MRVSKVYEFALGRWKTWEELYSRPIIHMSSTGNAEKLSVSGKAVVIESAVTPKSARALPTDVSFLTRRLTTARSE
jgi:hypothetical protein